MAKLIFRQIAAYDPKGHRLIPCWRQVLWVIKVFNFREQVSKTLAVQQVRLFPRNE